MQFSGHIALALAQHRLLTLSGQGEQFPLEPLLIAAFFPDAVDKTIGYVFHLMPNGRHFAHNIFSLVGLSLAVALVWGKTVGWAWFFGYLGHLLADNARQVPWFFPVKKYHFRQGRLRFNSVQLFKETIFLLLALIIYWTLAKNS